MSILKKCKDLRFVLLAVFTFVLVTITLFLPIRGHTEDCDKTGVLLVSFGEPDTMEESYEGWQSFLKNYMGSMMGMMKLGVIAEPMKEMTDLFKSMTLLLDIDHPFSSVPHFNRNLVDAWGRPYNGRHGYYFVPRPTDTLFESLFDIPEAGDFIEFIVDMCGGLPSVYIVPRWMPFADKPGKGYPDIWEYFSLTMYPMYAAMNDKNPALDRETRILDYVENLLHSKYPWLPIDRGFGAARDGYPDFLEAAESMVDNYNLETLIIAQNYIVHSDFENPAGEIEDYLAEKGYNVRVVIAEQIGGTEPFSNGVAEKVAEEIKGSNPNIGNAPIPSDENVMVFLCHHGMLSLNMILYDFGNEPYHYFAQKAFDACVDKIMALPDVASRTGDFMILKIYPEMSTGILDPYDEYLSIDEAMEIADNLGFDHIINVSYEVGNSGYEALCGLRGAWGIDPVWDTYEEDDGISGTRLIKYRNSFERDSINVIITDGWINGQADAYYQLIEKALN